MFLDKIFVSEEGVTMRKNLKTMFLMVVLLSFVSVSCKGKSTSSATTDKHTLHVGVSGEPGSLDPHFVSGTWENYIVGDLFLGLLTEAADGTAIAGAAESWDINEDGTTYTFHLRRDGRWSDGKPVTAEDFVFAFRRILDPMLAAKYANILYSVKNAEALNSGKLKGMEKLGIKAIDKYTLQITLENPTPYFLVQLTHYTAFPLPKHVVEEFGKEWSKPQNMVSNGAYKLAEWKSQTYIKAVKSETFYDAGNVAIEEVYYYPTEDRSAALKRFRAGELDTNNDIPLEQFEWLKKNMSDELHVYPRLGIYYYAINQRQERFQDKRVRKALALTVDREMLTDKVVTTGVTPAYSFVPPVENYSYAELDFKALPKEERIAKAKKLLQEAGYTEENPLKLQISYNTSENHKKIAVAIAAMWKAIGIDVSLLNSEVAVHYNEMEAGNFDISRVGWIADYPDAQNFLMLLQYPNTLNYGAYHNEKYNEKMEQAAHTVDLKKRAAIMKEAEQMALDDYAVIPIYYYVSKNLVHKNIEGWKPNSTDIHRSRWVSKQ